MTISDEYHKGKGWRIGAGILQAVKSLEQSLFTPNPLPDDYIEALERNTLAVDIGVEWVLLDTEEEEDGLDPRLLREISNIKAELDAAVDTADPLAALKNAKRYTYRRSSIVHSEADHGYDALKSSDAYCSLEVQDAVHELYSALASHWPSSCEHSHKAMLRLTTTPAADRSVIPNENKYVDFDIILSGSRDIWWENRFSVRPAEASTGVRFANPIPYNNAPVRSEDLCCLIESSAQRMAAFHVQIVNGKLNSEQAKENRASYCAYRTRLSLSALVGLAHQSRSTGLSFTSSILDRKSKLILATNLAYSIWHLSKDAWTSNIVLQDNHGRPNYLLHEGSWLQRDWQNEGFFFVEKHSSGERVVDLTRPYLPAMFPLPTVSNDPANLLNDSPTFHAYGMALIYLFSYEEFKSCREETMVQNNISALETGSVLANMDHWAGLQLLQRPRFQDDVDVPIQEIIDKCLNGKFVTELDLDLDVADSEVANMRANKIRSAFFQQVICPLKELLKITCRLSLGDVVGPLNMKLGTSVERSEANTQMQIQVQERYLLADDNQEYDIKAKEARNADQWFTNLQTRVHARLKPIEGQVPVRVAMLDTGMNLPSDISNRYDDQIENYSWLDNGISRLRTANYDPDGHGTHCGSVLLKVARNTTLYAVRVFETGQERRNLSGTNALYERIAKAIDHAVNSWEVDIITLSFGFKKRVDVIHRAIQRACNNEKKRVLVFAAASNQGGSEGVYFPASMDEVILVHATDGLMNPAEYTPNVVKNRNNFAVLGSAVEGYRSQDVSGSKTFRMSGTSCATPVAAGIAATILGFVERLRSSHSLTTEENAVLSRLRETKGMSSILLMMHDQGSKNRGDYDPIIPWLLFDRYGNASQLDFEHRFLQDVLEKLRW